VTARVTLSRNFARRTVLRPWNAVATGLGYGVAQASPADLDRIPRSQRRLAGLEDVTRTAMISERAQGRLAGSRGGVAQGLGGARRLVDVGQTIGCALLQRRSLAEV